MVSPLILFSFTVFKFLIKYSDNYNVSSSKSIYIETILRFPEYNWHPRGITKNPNIKKQDVINNPNLPWIMTEFNQKWVDYEWVNSFPYYNEEIILSINGIPDFMRTRIINGEIPNSINFAMSEAFPFLIMTKQRKQEEKNTYLDFETLIMKHNYKYFYIEGNTNFMFYLVDKFPDVIFEFSSNVFFVEEFEKFLK